MNKDNVISFENRELFEDPLTGLIRNRAKQLIALLIEGLWQSMTANTPKPVIGR